MKSIVRLIKNNYYKLATSYVIMWYVVILMYSSLISSFTYGVAECKILTAVLIALCSIHHAVLNYILRHKDGSGCTTMDRLQIIVIFMLSLLITLSKVFVIEKVSLKIFVCLMLDALLLKSSVERILVLDRK